MILDEVSFPEKPPRRWQTDDCDLCIYCDVAVGGNFHEHDHFPVPKIAGGTMVVPACPTCHHLKDRVGFGQWDMSIYLAGQPELMRHHLMADFHNVPEIWFHLSREARLLWGKLAMLHSHGERLGMGSLEAMVASIAEVNGVLL